MHVNVVKSNAHDCINVADLHVKKVANGPQCSLNKFQFAAALVHARQLNWHTKHCRGHKSTVWNLAEIITYCLTPCSSLTCIAYPVATDSWVQSNTADQSWVGRPLQYPCKALHCTASACYLTCRKYCSQDPNWTDPLLLLEQWDGAGWQLIRELAAGNVAASELIKNKFCQV